MIININVMCIYLNVFMNMLSHWVPGYCRYTVERRQMAPIDKPKS